VEKTCRDEDGGSRSAGPLSLCAGVVMEEGPHVFTSVLASPTARVELTRRGRLFSLRDVPIEENAKHHPLFSLRSSSYAGAKNS